MENDISVAATTLVAPGVVAIHCSGASTVGIFLDSADTPTGFSYMIEGTVDGSNWFTVPAVDPTLNSTVWRVAQTTTTGQWVVPCGGLQEVRFNLTAITGGHAIVTLNAGAGVNASHAAGGVLRLVNTLVSLTPTTSGGLTTLSMNVLNNNLAIIVKASPGQLYGFRSYNNGNTVGYMKLYNDTTAIAGAGTPFDRIALPAGHRDIKWENGIAYGTGIVAIIVTDFADNGTTAPAAGEYQVSFDYK